MATQPDVLTVREMRKTFGQVTAPDDASLMLRQGELLTFDGWALDGYLKVFWRNASVWQLWPRVLVLAMLAAVFLTLARVFARRWERRSLPP